MPIPISLKPRKVILNEEMHRVIGCYRESLEKQNGQKEIGSDADLGDIESRSGIWGRYVAATLEAVTEEKHGSKLILLPERHDIELEAPAEILLRSYLKFLNGLLIVQKIDAEEAQKELIESKYVLVYELLYRLVCISLCNKLDYRHDGEKLVGTLSDFIGKLSERELLLDPRLIGPPKTSEFLSSLLKGHGKWTAYITQMVQTVKLIRSNSRIISNILSELKRSEQVIQMHLIAFINPEEKSSSFDPKWLDTTLERCETQCIRTKAIAIANADYEKLNFTEHQKNVLSRSKLENNREKVMRLYDLLNRNRFLYEMMSHLDLLITYTGWMSILVGVINFDKLKCLIEEYSKFCKEVLDNGGQLEKIEGSEAKRGLIKYGAIKAGNHALNCVGIQSAQGLDFCVKELSDFEDDNLKQRIEKMIISSVSSLVNLQSSLPDEQRFINVDKIKVGLKIGSGSELPTLSQEDFEQKNKISRKQDVIAQLREESRRLQEENKRLKIALYQTKSVSIDVEVLTELLYINLIKNTQSIEILRMLRQQGASLDTYCKQENFEGFTVLHIAVITNNLMACRWLVEEEGVSINIQDSRGKTAIQQAIMENHKEIIEYFDEVKHKLTQELHSIIDDEDVTEEECSIKKEQMDKLRELVQHGADINGINDLTNAWAGDRPLHTLLLKGNKILIRWAIESGGDLSLTESRRGETPLQRLHRTSWNPEPVEAFLAQLDKSEKGKESPSQDGIIKRKL